jgi:SAM-dependent methyltransferase
MSQNLPADPVGAETLERLAAAPRFNAWLFSRLRRWIGQDVLEIGSGIGNLSDFLVGRRKVVLSDADPSYVERLLERFAGRPNVTVTQLSLPAVDGAFGGASRRFDTILCVNVLEHIAEDVESLRTMRRLLVPGGRLVLLVPALPALYGTLDRALGHVRRYTSAELRRKFAAVGLKLAHLEYFNLGGLPGWWLTGRVLRRDVIPSGSLAWFERLVPLFRLERFLPWRLGQSLIAIGEAAHPDP